MGSTLLNVFFKPAGMQVGMSEVERPWHLSENQIWATFSHLWQNVLESIGKTKLRYNL